LRGVLRHGAALLAAPFFFAAWAACSNPDRNFGSGSGGAGTGSGATGGAGTTGGQGGAPACSVVEDCPGSDDDCAMRACEGGACKMLYARQGTPLVVQEDGDCVTRVCDGMGAETAQPAEDPFVDGKACTDDVCTRGVPSNPALAANTICSEGDGTICDGMGACVECVQTSDCSMPSLVCQAGQCVPLGCANMTKDGDETDVDCGGLVCNKCKVGDDCLIGTDCEQGVCNGAPKTCKAPTCTDGVENGTETDVDCGSNCPDCQTGEGCVVDGDCVSQVCTNLLCQAPTCMDGKKNGSETDVDCGGGCGPCGNGEDCMVPGDCISLVCQGGKCQTPTCSDGVKNGGEVGVDCGGTCPMCGSNMSSSTSISSSSSSTVASSTASSSSSSSSASSTGTGMMIDGGADAD
jgi:hypothetical protein